MRNGPSLVIRGTMFGSLVLALLGWLLAGHLDFYTKSEVAYAAAPSPAAEQISATEKCQLSLSFPDSIRQWCELIMEQANQVELPPDLIAAVILQESGGNEIAYSVSGAVGLMQVMPRDGIATSFECINGPCFASRPTIEELLDPGYNIEYGTHMLAGLLARLGDIRHTLKAYGPMDVGFRYADKVLAIYENYR